MGNFNSSFDSTNNLVDEDSLNREEKETQRVRNNGIPSPPTVTGEDTEEETDDNPSETEPTNGKDIEQFELRLQLDKATEDDSLAQSPLLAMTGGGDRHYQHVRTETISIPCTTETCSELKKHIEDKLHIPVSLQTLYFQSQRLSDTECITTLHLPLHHDTIRVEYNERGLITEINQIMEKMREALDFLKRNTTKILQKEWSLEFSTEVRRIFTESKAVLNLSNHYFTFIPRQSKVTYANRVYFVHNNGIKLISDLQKQLVSIPWHCMSFEMQSMERAVLSVIWKLSSGGLRSLALALPGFIDSICESATRQKILTDVPIRAPINQRAVVNPYVLNMSLNAVLIDTMFKGMGILTNLSEIETCQYQLASKLHLMEQLAAAMFSQSMNTFTTHVIISTFLNLSYNPKTHRFLTTPSVINRVLESHHGNKRNYSLSSNSQTDLVLLKYYSTLFFSLICNTSDVFAECDDFEVQSVKVLAFIKDFIHDHSVDEVKDIEVREEYFWSTLKPFVNLVYFGYDRKMESQLVRDKPLLKELYQVSISAGLFCLSVACSRGSDCIDVLENEDQIDFIVCLPWCINELFKKDAQVVVELLSEKKKLTPPKLLNIAKAKLATFTGIPPEGISTSSEFINDIYHQFYHD